MFRQDKDCYNNHQNNWICKKNINYFSINKNGIIVLPFMMNEIKVTASLFRRH